MRESNSNIKFNEIPEDYKILKNSIDNEIVQEVYSKFIFHFFDFENDKKTINESLLLDYFKEYRFITYQVNQQYSKLQERLQNDEVRNENNIDPNFASSKLNAIICVEGQCFIFENINFDISTILKETKSSLIDISFDKEDCTKIEREAAEEVLSFCEYYKKSINSNKFVKYTIRPIISYLIRRYFYPSYFFNDQTFFSLIDQNKRDFRQKDFIILRQVDMSDKKVFLLVMNINNLGLFMMKKAEYLNQHEIDFCNNYSHQCLCHFYGFVKEKDRIVGFIYEFMSNGSLSKFLNKNYFYSFFTLIRVFEGISYLHSNSLIFRDLHPSNILIDHNLIPFISDFETIRNVDLKQDEIMTQNIGAQSFTSPEQFNGEIVSFPTDIFSFGVLIYYLFEQKNVEFEYNDIPQMTSFADDITELYSKCVRIDPRERPDINEIRIKLSEHITLCDNLKFYFQKGKKVSINENEMHDFYNENVHFLSSEYLQKYKELFSDFSYFLVNLGCLFNEGKFVEQDFLEAKKLFEISAKQNNPIAQLYLGNLYCNGKGVEQDYSKARYYYELSANQNNSDAFDCLGNIYYNGRGVKVDYQKAKEYYEIAAQSNNSDALFSLGFLYYAGKGCKTDYTKAKYYYEKAAELNNSNALNGLGNIYSRGLCVLQDNKKALEYYILAAKYNNSMALLNLGNIFLEGKLVKQDINKALDLYERSGNLGNMKGYIAIGNYYYCGKCTEADYKKAFEYYKKAADNNDADGLNMIGFMYDKGKGVDIDYMEAKRYYEMAIKFNHQSALNNLGKLYYNGDGMPKDYLKAKQLFEQSVKLGNERACVLLGKLYLDGVEKDCLKAIELFEKVADKYSLASYLIGNLYFEGKDVKPNYQKAKEYFIQSFKNKNNDAGFKLGLIYLYGLGTERDYKEAIKYFMKIRNVNSLFYLGLIFENGKGVTIDVEKAINFYKQSIEIEKENYIMEYSQGWVNEIRNNDYYRASQNNLGLLYLFEKNDHEMAISYIKESSFAEYPFGQNNYGLFNHFFLKNIDKALYLYEKSSKKEFALAEYNLGYYFEKNDDIQESIIHYKNALKYADIPLKFKLKEIDDERLEISNIFIICFLNMKLIHIQKEITINQLLINAIFRPLFYLLFQSDSQSYSFQFNVQKNNEKYHLANLNEFILGFPLFHLRDQINSFSTKSLGWKTIENSTNKSMFIKIGIINDEIKNNAAEKKTVQQNDEIIIVNDNELFVNDIQAQVKQIFNNLNKNSTFQLLENETVNEKFIEIKFKSKNDDIVRYLQYPKCLYAMLFHDLNRLNEITKNIFQKMEEIIYTEPYQILFGRIKLHQEIKIQNEAQEINENFYSGFSNIESQNPI